MAHALAPDCRLIWTIARPSLNDAEREWASLEMLARLDAGHTADALLTELAGHGLVPLAYRHFVAGGDECLPPVLSDALSSEFRRHACSRFRFAQFLCGCLDALERAGVAAVPFKGPALAVQLFGNFAMRQYGDLDILVHPSQVDDACNALTRERLVTRPPQSDDRWKTYLRATRHAESLVAHDGLLLELHWAIADRFHGVDLAVPWLLENTTTIDLIGRPTAVMGVAQTLLALCLHGTKHLWERAAWLSEMATILSLVPAADWALVFEHADRIDLGRSLRACLRLVGERFPVRLPEPWHTEVVADRGSGVLASALGRHLAAGGTGQGLASFRVGYLARGTLRQRVAFGWRVATELSERDVMALSAPPHLPAAYGVRRTLRLVRAAVAERRRQHSGLGADPGPGDTR